MNDKLAINGGDRSFDVELPPHPLVGKEEREAVDRVFESNQFSEFIASPGKQFYGGREVCAFQEEVAQSVDCKYGVGYNSWTSGLHGAVAACGVQTGDIVYTTPYTFTSSASSALMVNAVPVFVDVDLSTANISAATLKDAIGKHPGGKALVLVHLFGLPADMDDIIVLCKEHGIRIIEDAAQAPGAIYKGRMIGSIGDCGGFSFTQSKTVMCGEGGVLVTNDKDIAEVAGMVRNHGEVMEDARTYNSEFLGMGYRMTELEAAIGRAQWKKLDYFNSERINYSERLRDHIKSLCEYIYFQEPTYEHKHVYYVMPMFLDPDKTRLSRDDFAQALIAEGVPVAQGYVKPLYYQTLYQNRNHPALKDKANVDYSPGLCTNAEELHFNRTMFLSFLRAPLSEEMFNQLLLAFSKVIQGLGV